MLKGIKKWYYWKFYLVEFIKVLLQTTKGYDLPILTIVKSDCKIELYLERCRVVMVMTTAQLHSTKPELRLCASSNPAPVVSEIREGEDLWQWLRMEIRLNAFRRSIIPQKQFKKTIHQFKINVRTDLTV